MRNLILLLMLFSSAVLFAQEPVTTQKEIDHTLWKPFKIAFETNDADALNALYAKEVLRVTPSGIDTESKFKVGNIERFNKNKANGTTIKLDFWMDSRHTNIHTSYEVGFYSIKLKTGGEEHVVYGQFHIVLKKINGEWKITQDWDSVTINGEKITAKDFEKQEPLQFE